MKNINQIILFIFLVLVSSGCENKKDRDRKLREACISGDVYNINRLIKLGVNINEESDWSSSEKLPAPIHIAAEFKNARVIKILLENGASVDLKTIHNGVQPIHFAAYASSMDSISILLLHGAKIDSVDAEGMQPIHYAAECMYGERDWPTAIDTIDFLIAHGANASVKAKDGSTPAVIALKKGNKKIAAYLVKQEAKETAPLDKK